jgi:O-antigen/teichoic acid export membrane protein
MKLSLATQAGLLAASRAAGQVLNALVGIVVVRFISQEDYGTFRQVYLLFATLVVLTDLGLTESLYYFLPRNPGQRRKLMLRSTWVVGLAQVGGGLAMLLGAGALGRFFNNAGLAHYVGLLAVYIGLSAVTRLWEVQLVAEQRVPLAALVAGGSEALKVGLMFVSLAVQPGIGGLMWALVAGAGLKALGYGWFLLREFAKGGPAGGATNEGGDSGEQFRYAMGLWVPAILNTLAMQAHQFIVGYSFTPAEYAIYSVACFQVPLVGVLTTSIIEVMLVRVTEARAQGREEEVKRVWHQASTKSLLVFIPIATGLAVAAQPLITLLFTPAYAAAAPLFAILMISLPLNAVFTNNLLRAYGAMTDYAKFYTARLLLGLALGIAGVAWLGMWGVALSSVVTLYVIVGWQLTRVAELLRVSFATVLPWGGIGKIILASVLAAMPAGACVWWIAWPGAAVTAALASYGVAYALLALKMGLLEREDLRGVANDAMRVLARLGVVPSKAKGAAAVILLAAVLAAGPRMVS